MKIIIALLNPFVTCLILSSRVEALDVIVTDALSCEELPVSVNITWLCNENSSCTFGEEVVVEGERT